MARIRTIKPEFFCSEQVADCSTTSRLLFVGLWCFVDDQGVHPWKPRQIKMQVFPGDDFSTVDIETLLGELEAAGLVIRFEAEGSQYLAVTGWHHQKIEKPRFIYPAPPKSTTSRRRIDDESTTGSRGVGSLPDPTRPDPNGDDLNTVARKRAVFVPPSVDEVGGYCLERVNGIDAEQFVAYYAARGWRTKSGPIKDWKACIVTWEKNKSANPPAAEKDEDIMDILKRRRAAKEAKESANGSA